MLGKRSFRNHYWCQGTLKSYRLFCGVRLGKLATERGNHESQLQHWAVSVKVVTNVAKFGSDLQPTSKLEVAIVTDDDNEFEVIHHIHAVKTAFIHHSVHLMRSAQLTLT